MSKTFKGFASDRELTVKGCDDGSQVELLVMRSATGLFATGIAIAPSDAPALALAILEAAGVVPVQRDYESYDDGTPAHLQAVTYFLKQHNEAQERATAEARERAELEAEALELLNAEREEFSCTPVRDLSEVPARDQRAAIAVARRAREMRAEK